MVMRKKSLIRMSKGKEQVRHQNELLNTILEAMTHPFYIIDANDYTIKIANSALYRGKLPEKTTCYMLTHKRDKPCNGSDEPCPLEEIKKSKRPIVTEHVHYDKDGNPRKVEVHAYPILDDKGNVSEIIEYALDITERKQAEESLKKSENKYRILIENIPQKVFLKDRNSVYVSCNKNYAADLDIEPEEIAGRTDFDFYSKELADKYRTDDSRVVESAQAEEIDEKYVQAGKESIVHTVKTPVKDEHDNVVGVLGIFWDITERKQAEVKLKQTAEEWITTFDSITDMVSIHDKDFKIVKANKSFAKAFKMELSEIIGKTCCELIHKTKEPPLFCPHIRTLGTGKPNCKEFFEPCLGIYVEASTSPLFDEDGQIMASVHIAKDITKRKQAEAELKAAQEKLIEIARKVGMAEVAADVLHNVGNVLNSINVSTTVIREKITGSELANLEKVASIINEHNDDLGTFLTEDPQGKHIPIYLTEVSKYLTDEQTDIIDKLKVLAENVQHIKDIINMQQSYAKVSGVEVQTSLSKLAEDAIQINSAGLERHGTRLIREFEELGDVEIDKQKLLQILVNLISNAKYALSGSNKEEKLVIIRIYKHSEARFRIEVADNGVGVSKDNLAKIFSHGFTTKKDGHGFGLHSSALASKEMGGSLTVHSDGVGQGATFTLELPFKPTEVMK